VFCRLLCSEGWNVLIKKKKVKGEAGKEITFEQCPREDLFGITEV